MICLADAPHFREQVNAIRRSFYGGFPMINDPEVRYYVRHDENLVVTACFGIKLDAHERRALVVDMYGTNAHDWMELYKFLLHLADENGLELSGWVGTENKNIKTFLRTGWAKSAYLMRRQPTT